MVRKRSIKKYRNKYLNKSKRINKKKIGGSGSMQSEETKMQKINKSLKLTKNTLFSIKYWADELNKEIDEILSISEEPETTSTYTQTQTHIPIQTSTSTQTQIPTQTSAYTQTHIPTPLQIDVPTPLTGADPPAPLAHPTDMIILKYNHQSLY